MPQAAAAPRRKAKPGHIPVRVDCPLALFEKISAYRHECRYDTRSQAVLALLAAGLTATTRPPDPRQLVSRMLEATASPADRAKRRLVPYAGADSAEKSL